MRRALTKCSTRRGKLVVAAALLVAGACGGGGSAQLEERLWIDRAPKGPRTDFRAMIISEVGPKRIGAFFFGSAYRGSHSLYLWKGRGKGAGELERLQDKRRFDVTFHECRATAPFDMCIELRGGPDGTVRYQSRKRWKLPRKGKNEAFRPIDSLMALEPQWGLLGGEE